MSPKAEHVSRELLAIGFRAYPRGLANGLLFGCLMVALMWPGLPHEFLVSWLAAVAVVAACRLALARSYLVRPPAAAGVGNWARYAAVGYACTGIAWGILGAAAIHFAPDTQVYILMIVFLISIFAVLQTQTTGAHPIVFRTFLLCAMGPILAISVVESAPNYWLRILAELLLLAIVTLVGRSGNRYVADSIAMRYENLELLAELTRQKEELARANHAKTRFLAAASHDLRQPMQAAVLLVESLQERVHEAPTRRIVESIGTAVTTMSTLLNEILDISRFDAGTVKPQPTSFPAASVLDRVRASFAQPAAQKQLFLRVRRTSVVVDTDPVLLYRILANLVNNALRYTREGGVLVACRRRKAGVAIEVWDTGIGIPQDQIPEIFREFHQLANPERDREQGLGLGLAIVERTARVLDHPLTVHSRVGRGSVFSLLVPYGDAARVRASERSRAADALEGCTVLVVEDEDEIRAAMTILLEGWGCRVLAASCGAQVDAALALHPAGPDAVLADYRMPGAETGIDVIRRVVERYPRAHCILISGDIAPELLRQAEEAGYPLLHKPLRPARLRALLGAAWRERHAETAA